MVCFEMDDNGDDAFGQQGGFSETSAGLLIRNVTHGGGKGAVTRLCSYRNVAANQEMTQPHRQFWLPGLW